VTRQRLTRKQLLSELAEANQALSGYLLNVLAVHKGEAKPVALEVQAELGRFLVEVGLHMTEHVMNQVGEQHRRKTTQ